VDGVVLLAGCDKTTPALLMGAISMGCPRSSARRADAQRPLLQGPFEAWVGAGTHTRKFWDEYQAGNITSRMGAAGRRA
jgi:dihydroxyacid dehydratase/phosphogluconate dehydratase